MWPAIQMMLLQLYFMNRVTSSSALERACPENFCILEKIMLHHVFAVRN